MDRHGPVSGVLHVGTSSTGAFQGAPIMAHNLATTEGKPAMMYTGTVPWHHLGTKLDQPATAREAIETAGYYPAHDEAVANDTPAVGVKENVIGLGGYGRTLTV